MRQAASHTATLVALYRAIESSRSATVRLFDDAFAPAFLGWRSRWALRLSRLPVIGPAMPWSLIDGHWAGPRGTVAVRTRYIDDALEDALRGGLAQVVILGAGFDCRAYRIPGIDRTRVFEVDHPATQPRKREIITRRLRTTSRRRWWTRCCATRPGARLPGAGWSSRTSSAPCSTAPCGSRARRTRWPPSGARGSPTRSASIPSSYPPNLAERGLRLIEDVGADAYRARYLLPRGRQREPLAEYQRAAQVEVVGNVGM